MASTPPSNSQLNAQLAELSKLRVANTDNFDKSIITLASFSLGLSLSFLKDFLPIDRAEVAWMLYGSWALFTASIFSTLASFFVSNRVLAESGVAYKAYFGPQQVPFDGTVPSSKWLAFLGYSAAICFFVALAFTSLFVGINLSAASKYKEGFCKDEKGIFVPCKPGSGVLAPSAPPPTNSDKGVPSQSLKNSVVVNLVDNRNKTTNEDASKATEPRNADVGQSLQNTVILTLPYSPPVVTWRGKKNNPCKPCDEPKSNLPIHKTESVEIEK
ncbi:hypothetical protein GTP56_15100 [Duganella sp. FT134W]|uniref:Uncharacterized protein n=1 Tax=Duganella margarita TaxID=2692170 RepID=A0A7X4H1E6_9BURK|nr:hypothetical protein [Duganella margarita]MYM73518.1 hypothetical protein [Duganella margarita]